MNPYYSAIINGTDDTPPSKPFVQLLDSSTATTKPGTIHPRRRIVGTFKTASGGFGYLLNRNWRRECVVIRECRRAARLRAKRAARRAPK